MKKVKCKISNKDISMAWVWIDDNGEINNFEIIEPIETIDIEIISELSEM